MKFSLKNLYVCVIDKMLSAKWLNIKGEPLGSSDWYTPYYIKKFWDNKCFLGICVKKNGKYYHVVTKQPVVDDEDKLWGFEENMFRKFDTIPTPLEDIIHNLGRSLSYKEIVRLEKELNNYNKEYLQISEIKQLYRLKKGMGCADEEAELE